jgi:hypothetical protein
MEESDSELDAIEQQLSTLKQTAAKAEDAIVAAMNKLKVVQYKARAEMEELAETELRSKPALRKWLQARDLSTDCSFQEFFDAFLQEHKEDHRLDITDRSILLNADGCKLFGLAGKDKKILLLELLERLPAIYH